jgi:BirA family biotin operon repressor/biotin-[acetyl-CoA-carboxylase] ligase
MTVTLAPPEQRYPIITGVAVRSALAGLVEGHGVAIKWPNDIVISGKKVCGILCEMRAGITAVGLGINVNQDSWPKELEARSISLEQVSHCGFALDDVARTVTDQLCEWIHVFRSKGFGPVRDEFLCHGMLEGYEIFDERGDRCTIVDLTAEGHLVIDTRGIRKTLIHEPVSLGWDNIPRTAVVPVP